MLQTSSIKTHPEDGSLHSLFKIWVKCTTWPNPRFTRISWNLIRVESFYTKTETRSGYRYLWFICGKMLRGHFCCSLAPLIQTFTLCFAHFLFYRVKLKPNPYPILMCWREQWWALRNASFDFITQINCDHLLTFKSNRSWRKSFVLNSLENIIPVKLVGEKL